MTTEEMLREILRQQQMLYQSVYWGNVLAVLGRVFEIMSLAALCILLQLKVRMYRVQLDDLALSRETFARLSRRREE